MKKIKYIYIYINRIKIFFKSSQRALNISFCPWNSTLIINLIIMNERVVENKKFEYIFAEIGTYSSRIDKLINGFDSCELLWLPNDRIFLFIYKSFSNLFSFATLFSLCIQTSVNPSRQGFYFFSSTGDRWHIWSCAFLFFFLLVYWYEI